jgi:hypothetical protein
LAVGNDKFAARVHLAVYDRPVSIMPHCQQCLTTFTAADTKGFCALVLSANYGKQKYLALN